MSEHDPGRAPTPPAGAHGRLAGATVGMAVGTTLSRITGVGRVIALTAAVGGGGFADAYNLANTTPNIITDVVIGGVLAATFVPVFVSRLTTRPAEEAWEAISAVITVASAILLVATVAFFVLTPSIVDLYTVTNHHADVHQQQQAAVFLLRWFVPQLTFYGLIALMTALLNTQGKFAAPMFVPIANNLVVIAVLAVFHVLVPHPSLSTIEAHRTALVLLGIGTTLGVVVQAVLLAPSLVRADLHLRVRWAPGHEAVRRITRLAGWTLGIVLANQVALVVVLALADGARIPGAVSAYTYAYTFFQLPYGIVAVSIMTAVTPSLSARWATGDLDGFQHRMAFGLRGILAVIIPSAAGMLVLAHPLIQLVLAHAAETTAQADATASALAMFALGLPGFCTFLYMIRVLQAMQDTRTGFGLYLVENAVNIVLGVVLVGPLGVRGLALSVSVAYSVGALLALSVVRRRVGGLGGHELTTPVTRVLTATGVMTIVAVLALSISGATSGPALLGRVVLAIVAGTVAYVGTAAVLGARAARRTREERAMRAEARRPPDVGPAAAPAPSDGTAPVAHRPVGSPSVRLLGPAPPPTGGAGETARPRPHPGPSSPTGFHGRLGAGPPAPARHLRPVPSGPGGPPTGAEDGPTAADRPADEPAGDGPPGEEETDGPDPGGDR